VGFVVNKLTLEHVFLEYFDFPLKVLFHQRFHIHLHIRRQCCYNLSTWQHP